VSGKKYPLLIAFLYVGVTLKNQLRENTLIKGEFQFFYGNSIEVNCACESIVHAK